MKKSRFLEIQIISILKEAENGLPVAEICCKYGMSEATLYSWRSKYGGMDVSFMRQCQNTGRRKSSFEKNVC